jgi:large subunit ribosomal protein L24
MKNKVTTTAKIKIRKGDLVKVIAGDSKGQQGKVQEIIVAKSRIIVEGINLVSKHTKPNTATPNGGIIKKEAALHISNVQLIDPKSSKITRVGRKLNADGKLVRVAKISGEEIK